MKGQTLLKLSDGLATHTGTRICGGLWGRERIATDEYSSKDPLEAVRVGTCPVRFTSWCVKPL